MSSRSSPVLAGLQHPLEQETAQAGGPHRDQHRHGNLAGVVGAAVDQGGNGDEQEGQTARQVEKLLRLEDV